MQRYFIPQKLAVGQTFKLDETTQKHWVQVMRGVKGEHAEVVDQAEQLFMATLTSSMEARVDTALDKNGELPVEVSIVSGLPKQDKTEWIVQKATEMGAFAITFFAADWSVAKWPENKVARKLERLNKIAQAAAQQAHRTHIPAVTYQPKLADAIVQSAPKAVAVAYEEAAKAGEKAGLYQLLTVVKNTKLTAVFGPEGGLSPAEVDRMTTQFSARVVGLGPRILRTETAPLYFLAAVSTLTELSS